MKLVKMFTLLIAAAMIMMVAGCGSSKDSSGSVSSGTDALANAATVGINNCLTCHSPASTLVQGWMNSRHGNHMLGAAKIPQDASEIPEDDPRPDHCGYCHPEYNGVLDYGLVQTFEDPAVTDWSAPVSGEDAFIACEDCHGGGQFHNGIAAGIPYSTPGPKQCGQCHYLNGDIDNDEWAADGEYPHHTTARRATTAPEDVGNTARRNVLDTHIDDPATSYEVADAAAVCDDTDPAYDAAACSALNVVEGYAIRYNQQNGCVDCHFNGHEMDLSINYDWAASGHGGGLKLAKDKVVADYVAAGAPYPDDGDVFVEVSAAGSKGDEYAWGHYPWDSDSRASCQMCHTATGNMNFLSDQVNYDPANNDFSHLDGWTQTSRESGQNELLYCWSCHSDSDGNLRDPGAVTLAYTNLLGVKPTLPDMGNSNVCLNCHSGRGGMDRLLNGATADPAGAAVTGGTRTHYYASGATIYQDITNVGYMYGSLNYDNPGYYGHDGVGCAECHMDSENSHSYAVVEKDASGVIVSIESETCVTCHDGEHALFVADSQVGDTVNIWDGVSAAVPTVVLQADADAAAAELEHEAHGYHDAVEAMIPVLTAAGTPPKAGYPYFTGSATDQGHGGAMHNYSYLHHEPGAYAHNRFYAKRLIFDSIDWLTAPDGTVQVDPVATPRALDGQITLDTVADAAAIVWLGGDPATGIVATRP